MITGGALDRMAELLTVPFHRGADRLRLALQPDTAGPRASATIVAYDFAEHRARFGVEPDPRYVLTVLQQVTVATTVSIDYTVSDSSGSQRLTVEVPAGTLPGTSLPLSVNLSGNPATAAQLRKLTMSPAAPTGTVSAWWRLDALLGTIAKLLWVTGWERDVLHAQLNRVQAQRQLTNAFGRSLDLLGGGLGIPRFPPRPYSIESDTIALYHLDDDDPTSPVRDTMALLRGPGHPGQVRGAPSGVPGRFGSAFAFDDPTAEITMDHHADFTVGADASMTVECFIKPAAGGGDAAALSKYDPAAPNGPGWAVSVGGFGRGLRCNVRFLVSDGNAHTAVTLFADQSLPTDRFTHVAGVLDRGTRQARLYVDGSLRAVQPNVQLGAIANSQPVRIGAAGTNSAGSFRGAIDEVRLSRVARTGFHPVLGESDDIYRRRLRIFRRWTLPTRTGLATALNEVVGPLNGVADPFVITDQDSTVVSAGHVFNAVATEVTGPSIDDLGNRGTSEQQASGSAATDPDFDPTLLVDGTDPRIEFVTVPPVAGPGTPVADPRRMRVGTRRTLRALLRLLPAGPEKLRVLAGFDPGAADLRAVGRALVLSYPDLTLGELAARAHRAGFTWVQPQDDSVYASVRATDILEIEPDPMAGDTATPEHGFDLLTGQNLTLRAAPALPAGAVVSWHVIACGAGQVRVIGRTNHQSVTMLAIGSGEVGVVVQVRLGTRSLRAIRRLRIGVHELAAGQSIAADGALGVAESVAGAPGESFFDPAYLITADNWHQPLELEGISFAAGVQTRRMQPVVWSRLAQLSRLLAGQGKPEVSAAWEPTGSGLAAEGRALTLGKGTVGASLERLGALAHAAGFSYVRHDGTQLRLLQAAGELVSFALNGSLLLRSDQLLPEVTVDDRARVRALEVMPRAAPVAATRLGDILWTANAGTDTVTAIDTTTGRVIEPVVKVGSASGALAINPDGSRLYTADVGSSTVTQVVNGTVTGLVNLAGTPTTLAHHPTKSLLYVVMAGEGQDLLAEINTASLRVARTLPLANQANAIAIASDGNKLWIASGDSALRLVDTGTFVIDNPIPLPGRPTHLAVGTTRAYVLTVSEKPLQVIDTRTGRIQAAFPGFGALRGVVLTPSENLVLITDETGSESARSSRVHLRLADGSPVRRADGSPAPPLPLGKGPSRVAVASDDHAYVLRSGAAGVDTVAKLDLHASASTVAVWPLGTGHGERVSWSAQAVGGAQVALSGTTTPVVGITAAAPGPFDIRVSYQWPDHCSPFTAEVQLNPQLEAQERAGTPVVISKESYDLALNVLNHLHPAGVTIDTKILRNHVLELKDSLPELLPGYTQPAFRPRRSGRQQAPRSA